MDIKLILATKYVGCEWLLIGDDYSGLEWLDDSPKPSKKELEAQWDSVRIESELKKISDLRRETYVIESDPLFFAFQRGEILEQEWLAAVNEIKARYPYPDAL